MKVTEFRVDARRKMLRGREMFDSLATGWRVVPQSGQAVSGVVRVNIPPDLQRVESRLIMGPVKHERREVRHPEKSTLLAIEFEHQTETRGSITATPDHDDASIAFGVVNASRFGVIERTFAAADATYELMDELAKLLVGQPSRFA